MGSDKMRNPGLEPAVRSAGAVLARHAPIVIESTVPPGTTSHQLRTILEESATNSGGEFLLGYCPERAMVGSALAEIENNHQYVGCINTACS